MTGIERRITELERKTGLDKEVRFIHVKTSIFGNLNCPAFDNLGGCIRYQAFRRKPRVNENGFAVFVLDCEGCEGV